MGLLGQMPQAAAEIPSMGAQPSGFDNIMGAITGFTNSDVGQLAMNLLAAGGPSMQPHSLGQDFVSAVGLMQKAQQQKQQQQMQQLQVQALQKQMPGIDTQNQMQVIQLQQAREQQARQQQYQQSMDVLAPKLVDGSMKMDDFNRQAAANLLQADPQQGVSLLNHIADAQRRQQSAMVTPLMKELEAANIDYRSPEGQAIMRSNLMGGLPEQKAENEAKKSFNEGNNRVIAATLTPIQTNATTATTLKGPLSEFKQLIDTMPASDGAYFGPFASKNPLPPEKIQEVRNLAARITPQLKSLMGYPNSNFSDADLAIVKAASVGDVYNVGALKNIVARLADSADATIRYADHMQSFAEKNRSLVGANQQFLDAEAKKDAAKKGMLASPIPGPQGAPVIQRQVFNPSSRSFEALNFGGQ